MFKSGTSLTPSSLKNEYSLECGSIFIQSNINNVFHSRRLATDGKWRSVALYFNLFESEDSNVVPKKYKRFYFLKKQILLT